jgi:hypothetical protein
VVNVIEIGGAIPYSWNQAELMVVIGIENAVFVATFILA